LWRSCFSNWSCQVIKKNVSFTLSSIDCFTHYRTIRIPGLIDVHVHVRDPGETHKEDWETCTKSALAGGVTMICAMPNTKPALQNLETFVKTLDIASSKAVCDFALFAGACDNNKSTVAKALGRKCVALKMYVKMFDFNFSTKN
jgi:carbamoyl-phosphate synthase/aspartate carbamoyltransferase/dihydroorotase